MGRYKRQPEPGASVAEVAVLADRIDGFGVVQATTFPRGLAKPLRRVTRTYRELLGLIED
jgi:hypothetical protein